MKVLQINATYGRGSTGKITEDILSTLRNNGHEGYVAYGYFNSDEKKAIKLKKIGNTNILRFELMRCRLTGYYGFTDKSSTRRLIKLIEEIKPDIIHLHNIHGGFIHIELLFDYLSKKDIPIVWTVHDCWCMTGHCSHFQIVKCDKWKTGCFNCPEKTNYPKRYFFDRSKEQYERKKKAFTSVKNMTMIAVSDWLKGIVKESYFKNYPVYTINNGIDLLVFKPTENNVKQKLGIRDKKMVLGVQMSWSERKGWKYVLELAKRLNPEYKLVLVGLNDRQMKEIPENVIGFKKTGSQKELAEFYTAADVLINTSLEETFGLVNVEATACGTPVASFNSGGMVDTINETCGILVEKGNIDKLTEAVYTLANKDMSAACVKWAQNFDKSKKYMEYIEIYNKVLKDRE